MQDMKTFLLSLLLSLVKINCQNIPYVSFIGVNLPNHAYVDLTLVGQDISNIGNILRCRTDLSTCCTSNQGIHRGEWYFPDGTALLDAFESGSGDFFKFYSNQVIQIRRRNGAISPTGIYRCEIPTVAASIASDPVTGESVYIGLYPPDEGIHAIYLLSVAFT